MVSQMFECNCGEIVKVDGLSVAKCPRCTQFYASIFSIGRGKTVWIPIDNNLALFYDLTGEQMFEQQIREQK